MSEVSRAVRCRNILLRSVSDEEFDRLRGELEPMDTAIGDVPIREFERAEWAYFPDTCVFSVVRILEEGSMIEVGVVGYDGVVGIHSIGEEAEQPYRMIIQHPGLTWRMPLRRLREEFRRSGEFQEILLRYSTAFLLQVSQTAACNRLHTIEQRLGRWLLMMRDRTLTDELKLTQEFLSHMLGTRIAGVNEAIRALTDKGLIRHSRGSIEIVDREGLERSTCECYAFVAKLTLEPADLPEDGIAS
jgi:CRP-like cAMP-binding protein